MKIEEIGGKLVITDFNEVEAYKIASKVEKDGIDFYEQLLEKVPEKVKNELEFLLKEEKDHYKYFEDKLERERIQMGDDFEEDDILMTMHYGVFDIFKDIDNLPEIISEHHKVVKLGLMVENRAIEFYEVCKDRVQSPATKQELANIINQEKKHKELLKSFKDKQ